MQGKTFVPLPAHATVPGNTGAQPPGAPVFEGAGGCGAPSAPISRPRRPGQHLGQGALPRAQQQREQLRRLQPDSIRVIAFDPAAQPSPVAVGEGVRPSARGARSSHAEPRGPSGASVIRAADRSARAARRCSTCRVAACGCSPITTSSPRATSSAGICATWGRRVAPGIYLLRLASGAELRTRRLVVL